MAKQLQLRRGTTAQHSTFTGAAGEVTIDTDKKVVVVHDGSTAGGVPLAKQTTVDAKVDKITSTDNAIARYDGTGGAIQNSSVYIDDSGNVGIGTSSPISYRKLTLQSDGSAGGLALNNSAGTLGAQFTLENVSTSTDLGIYATGLMKLYTGSTERMRIDPSGNVGIGVTPSGWESGTKAIEVKAVGCGIYTRGAAITTELANNAVYSPTGYVYGITKNASAIQLYDGGFKFYTAPSGTAGNAITWNTAMTLDASGNLNVGASAGYHLFSKALGQGGAILSIFSSTTGYNSAIFNSVSAHGWNSAACALNLGANNSTGRAINAGGTINASGADYAEYENNNGLVIAKGQIVGFKVDGTLTDKYSESIRFAIKSTNPSLVGGDTWGSEDIVGKRPEQPIRKQDVTEQKLVSEAVEEVTEDKIIDAVLDDEGNEIEPSKIEKVVITPAQEAIYETVIVEAGDTDEEWEIKETQYKTDLADFEARLEAERIKVDRIAYSGKVPVNVTGAVAGQYVCVVAGENDSIGYELVNKADMTFVQYQDAVGRVNRILDDGRAEVAVVIH